MGDVAPDYVRIRSEDDTLTLLVRLGDGSPQLSGGVGGWEAVARPGHRPLTVWRGQPEALTYSIPLLFDGYRWDPQHGSGYSVEADCRTLERMGGLDAGDPEPPLLIIEGALPHDESRAAQNRWVLNSIEWGDAIRRPDGHRVRQAATVTLLLYTEDDQLKRAHRSRKPAYRYVRPRHGETWEKLAARKLGAKRYGNRLARLNGARDGSAKIKLDRVRLPTTKALRAWKAGR